VSALESIAARPGFELGRDALLAAVLTAAGLAEVLAAPAGEGDRAVSAVALACATVPLAWRRTLPLLPVAAVALALLVQTPLDGFLVGRTATPVVAIAIALYSAGRHVARAPGLAAAAVGVVVLSAIRVADDPAVDDAAQVVLTVVAVSLPLLVGRWVRGQALLQGTLARTAARLARDRERDARHAAEAERMRIAGDLQAAIAGGLREIAANADALPERLRAGDHATARALLARSATTAREALADVRRVLGILRREGQPLRLDPPAVSTVLDRPPPPAAGDEPVPAGDDPTGAAADVGRLRALAPETVDRIVAAVVLAGVELELALVAGLREWPVAVLSGLLISASLLWRRRRPRPAFAGVLGGVALQSALLDLGTFPVSDIAAMVCATYAVAAYAERGPAVTGLALALAGAGAHAAIFYPDGLAAALLGGVVAPWTFGRVVRAHRRLTGEGREEAARAERERVREAAAAVTRERMRIARELHDAVAHNISVIALQAGGADGIVERDPERAAESAALIGAVAREALVELDRLTRALDAAADEPRPGLAAVDTLAERTRAAGLQVELAVEGEPAPLPAGLDLAAYRIVQEALANASKHAHAGRVRVTVRYERRAIELEVVDDGRGPAPASGGGHGLVGMRERAALYGGTLDAGPGPSGGFRVHARLPIE
jgi:signal transduction histidine kinase